MKFKIGVGLLLFGILLSNAATTNIGPVLLMAAILVGLVGLGLIISDCNKDREK